MRAKAAALFIVTLSACLGTAQTQTAPSVARTLYFAATDAPQGMQEVVNVLRGVAAVPEVTIEAAQKSATLRGPGTQVEAGAWLFRELDQRPSPALLQREYIGPGSEDSVLRVYHLASTLSPQSLQEMVNLVRTVSDIQRIFPCNSAAAISLSGTAQQARFGDWLIKALNHPAGAVSLEEAQYEYRDPAAEKAFPAGANPTAVRVFYLKHAGTPQQVQELVNLIRTLGNVQRMFSYQPLNAIMVRGTPSQVALAEWLVGQLDREPTAAASPSPAAYDYDESPRSMDQRDVRVFRLANVRTAQDLQQLVNKLRSAASIQRVFPYTGLPAIALRGSAAQVGIAEQMIRQMDTPPVRP